MTYNKGHFDTFQSEAPQLVTWSFIMNLNSEFTWIYVKNNNWKLKICIFFPKWNENKNENGEAYALVSYGVTLKHILMKRIFDIHTKGSIDYTKCTLFAHFHNFLSCMNEKDKSDD